MVKYFPMAEEGECVSSEDSEVESVLLDEESDEDTDKVALNKLQQIGLCKEGSYLGLF